MAAGRAESSRSSGKNPQRGRSKTATFSSCGEEEAAPTGGEATSVEGAAFPLRPADEEIHPATLEFCRQAARQSHWPVGLCVAWIKTRTLDEAVQTYAIRREWDSAKTDDSWTVAVGDLVSALARGELEALAIAVDDPAERRAIPAAAWIDLNIVRRGPYDEVRRRDGSLAYRDVRIAADALRANWPVKTAAQMANAVRHGEEAACVAALKQLMLANPNKPTSKSEVQKSFGNVSKRAFDRAWSLAISETGATDWRAPGRRPSPRSDSK